MKRAVSDLKKSAAAHAGTARTERDLNVKVVFGGLAVVFALHDRPLLLLRRRRWRGGMVAAIVMIIARLLLRRRLRQPGGHDRLVQQSRSPA